MAFTYVGRVGTNVPPYDNFFLMTNNEASTRGEVLSLTAGRLTKTAATAIPDYVADKTTAAVATTVDPIPVIQVFDNIEFETTSTGQILPAAIGNLYTIHTDGLQITTTTTNGVFKVTYTDGAALSRVRGYFSLA